jgi:hypothetical protein
MSTMRSILAPRRSLLFTAMMRSPDFTPRARRGEPSIGAITVTFSSRRSTSTPMPAKRPSVSALELRELLGVHVRRVRIELRDHAAHRAVEQLLALRRLHIVVLDEDQHARHLIERQVGALGLGGRAREPARRGASGERGAHDGELPQGRDRAAAPRAGGRHGPSCIRPARRRPERGPQGHMRLQPPRARHSFLP